MASPYGRQGGKRKSCNAFGYFPSSTSKQQQQEQEQYSLLQRVRHIGLGHFSKVSLSALTSSGNSSLFLSRHSVIISEQVLSHGGTMYSCRYSPAGNTHRHCAPRASLDISAGSRSSVSTRCIPAPRRIQISPKPIRPKSATGTINTSSNNGRDTVCGIQTSAAPLRTPVPNWSSDSTPGSLSPSNDFHTLPAATSPMSPYFILRSFAHFVGGAVGHTHNYSPCLSEVCRSCQDSFHFKLLFHHFPGRGERASILDDLIPPPTTLLFVGWIAFPPSFVVTLDCPSPVAALLVEPGAFK